MAGLLFETRSPLAPPAPNRADVACFIGLVPLRGDPVDPFQPLESWEAFDQRYAWDRRPIVARGTVRESSPGQPRFCATYLGASVRAFFAQGGRRCFVVRAGDPLPVQTLAPAPGALTPTAQSLLEKLLPGYPGSLSPTPLDPNSWEGIGALFALPEVSYVAFPDLADVFAVERSPIPPPAQVNLPEIFVECSSTPAAVLPDRESPLLRAPRCDQASSALWGQVVEAIATFLRRWRREVQLVAALPLPSAGTEVSAALPRTLNSGFVQMVFPWVRTPLSDQLPGGLEPPEGVLVGLLARNALTRGSFQSAAGLAVADVQAVEPQLSRQQRLAPLPQDAEAPSLSFADRVSVIGPTPRRLCLLSDVTTSLDPSYRFASVHRLVTALVRAARSLGELHSFEASGEALWRQLRDNLETLLEQLWQRGALSGASAEEAFSVRCDRSTISQADLDSGRVVAEVVFVAALPIQTIRVVLAMEEGGQVSLMSLPP